MRAQIIRKFNDRDAVFSENLTRHQGHRVEPIRNGLQSNDRSAAVTERTIKL